MSGMGDVDEIKRVKYRYLRALDTKHWDEFADTLTEDIVGDYGSSLGEEHHFTDRDSLVEFMRSAMPANVLTEHRVTHPEIDVDGDEATGTWYLQDRVIVPDFDFMLYRRGLLPRPLPTHPRRMADQCDGIRAHVRGQHVDRVDHQFQGETRCGAEYLTVTE